jgi:hypothetical protein
MLSNIFFFLNDWVEKSQKKFENEWRKDENSFCDEEIHGIIMHLATSSVPITNF